MGSGELLCGGAMLSMGTAVVLATWVALDRPLPAAEAQVVDGFDVVRDRLRSFEAAYFSVSMDGAGWQIQVSAEGRVAVDPMRWGFGGYRYVWADGELTTIEYPVIHEPCPAALRVPAPPELAELWAELRSGFAASTVTRTLPEEIGYPYSWRSGATYGATDTEVVMIRLPFEWASDRRVFLEYLPDGRLDTLLVTGAHGESLKSPLPLTHQNSHFLIDFDTNYNTPEWDVPLDPGIFTDAHVDVSHPAYKKCAHDQGHHHGERLHEEHSDEEIHGVGTPRHHGSWEPSCDLPPDDGPGQSGADHGQGQDADHGQDGTQHGQAGEDHGRGQR